MWTPNETPPRLAAYTLLTTARWELVTETPAVLHIIAQLFGLVYQKVAEDNPPSVDWLTGKPLTCDINHSDGYVLIDPQGTERYSSGAAPNFRGKLNPEAPCFLGWRGTRSPRPHGVDAGGRIDLLGVASGTIRPLQEPCGI